MGIFINKGNEAFRQIRNSEYIDKSGLIAQVNKTLFTEQKLSCVTRCRRFGKSMAAKMLAAYYDNSCDSRQLFADLQIASDPSFEEHLNKYPVLYIDMTDFVTRFKGDDNIVSHIDQEVQADVQQAYTEVLAGETPVLPRQGTDLMALLLRVVMKTNEPFIFIIDEWDAICREFPSGSKGMDSYVDWLRRMFKSVQAVDTFACVYMTGILPIKKYKTQSALNNFREYSMVSPRKMAGFFGFTSEEVQALSEKHGMDFDQMKKWYDGYQIGSQPSMFNPNSVMQAIDSEVCESYWSATGSFETVANYINLDYDGLRSDIVELLAGGRTVVNPKGFLNDLSEIHSRDDVLTVLIHLGYLTYDRETQECYIPNMEVAGEMESAVKANKWEGVTEALNQSRRLLEATLRGDAGFVARALEAAHSEDTSILSYNDENSLACVISLAYYYARNDYHIHRKYATGKGFADLVLMPRKNVSKPAIIVELKYGHSAGEAIAQIKARQYSDKVAEYTGDLLLVGINYDRDTKEHTCQIEVISD